MNNTVKYFFSLTARSSKLAAYCLLLAAVLTSCGVYKFTDATVDPNIKTVNIHYLTNKARYVNPQLSPQLSEKLRQKVNNQTRLTPVQSDDAHLDISGYVADYSVTTAGISNQQAATNRLTVTIHIIVQNRVKPEDSFEADVSRNFDFSASRSLNQAEAE